MAKGRAVDGQPAERPTRKSVASRGRKTQPAHAKKAAARASERAKAEGATGAYGPRERRAVRDAAIVARAAVHTPYKQIASEYAVSVRTVEEVVRRSKESRSALERVPMQIVEDYARAFESAVDTFEAMAARQEERNASVALAARRAAQEARRDFLTLLGALGKLPDNLETFRMESELARLGQLVLNALDDVAAGKVAAVEASRRVKELVSRRELPLIEATAQ